MLNLSRKQSVLAGAHFVVNLQALGIVSRNKSDPIVDTSNMPEPGRNLIGKRSHLPNSCPATAMKEIRSHKRGPVLG